jgi:hypothetical protein
VPAEVRKVSGLRSQGTQHDLPSAEFLPAPLRI